MTSELANAVAEYGFPIVAATGMGWFVYYIWVWVTREVKPVLAEANATLIKLVDRVRMLDNDMIRLNTKLAMVLEHRATIERAAGTKAADDLQEIVDRNITKSETFDSTGKSNETKNH